MSDYEREYERALQEIKDLAKEYDDSVPEPLKERLKKTVKYAYQQLELNPNIPKHKRASKLMDDLAVGLNIVIPRATLYRWVGVDDDQEKSSQMRQNDSSIDPAIEQENEHLAIVAKRMEEFWMGVGVKCRQQHILSLIPPAVVEEGLYLIEKSAENNSQEWDGRQDVSERRFLTLVLASIAGADKATELFIKYVKEWQPLTGKQYMKLMSGEATICHPLFQPQTEQEAGELGFHGAHCEYLTCLDCEKKQEEELRKMKMNGLLKRDRDRIAPEAKVSINSRADSKACRICGGTNLVRRGCGERRLMFGTDAAPKMFVKCAACHAEFPPLNRKLPKYGDLVMEGQMSTHRA